MFCFLAYTKYYEFRDNTIIELLKPHLVIYLDLPVPKVIDNIKKRAISWEKNSTVLSPAYLKTMEENYKNYLKEIRYENIKKTMFQNCIFE